MNSRLLHRDVLGGVSLIAIAMLYYHFAPASESNRVGVGNTFPRGISISLMAIGLLVTGRGLITVCGYRPTFPLRGCAAITAGIVSFAVLIERAGLAPAVVATVMLSTLGFQERRFGAMLIFAIGLAAAMFVLFVGLLGQPIKLVSGF
jgi:hypothetical protein